MQLIIKTAYTNELLYEHKFIAQVIMEVGDHLTLDKGEYKIIKREWIYKRQLYQNVSEITECVIIVERIN